LALFRGLIGAGFHFFPIDSHARSVDNAPRRDGYLRPNTFAGNQGNFVSHMGISLYAMVAPLSKSTMSGRFQGRTQWQISYCAEERRICYNIGEGKFAGMSANGGQEEYD
jgi:hypothetical protein